MQYRFNQQWWLFVWNWKLFIIDVSNFIPTWVEKPNKGTTK